MCTQMRNFLDQTGPLWLKGSLMGKVGSVFTSTATQHGGQETTVTSFHTTLLHQGMIIVGVPYSQQGLLNMKEITGGSPYGAGTLAGSDGSRQPSENELVIARFQGKHVGSQRSWQVSREVRRSKYELRSSRTNVEVQGSRCQRRIEGQSAGEPRLFELRTSSFILLLLRH